MSFTRRSFVKTGAVLGVNISIDSLRVPKAVASRKRKSPIILVHGGWHGGWCWKYVTAKLLAAGHIVCTPTLTGLGERVHLASREINLDVHVQDIINVIEAEELSDVVLAGHSSAGMIITGVADRMSNKIKSLVYLDAFVPENGSRMIDYIAPERRRAMITAGEATGYLDPLPANILGIKKTADIEWVTRRMTRHPYATFSQQLHFQTNGGKHLPRTYVYCSNPPSGSFDQFALRFRTDPEWQFHELKTGHDCMITQPNEVARIILRVAR